MTFVCKCCYVNLFFAIGFVDLYKISKRYNKFFKKNIFRTKLLLIKKKGLKFLKKQIKLKNVILKALTSNYKYNIDKECCII